MLLLLDNFEHLLPAVGEIARLLAACPNLEVLATSREVLQLQAEHAYAVPTMDDEDGTRLFVARAAAASGESSSAETVAELCRRLDNLPLAIELAAARTRHLAPEQLLERLSQRLDLLKGGRDADPTPANAARDDRVVVRPARGGRAPTLRAPLRLRWRLHARSCRGGLRRRSRGARVARGQEPRAQGGRALLDAGDHPRLRGRAPTGGRRRGAAAAPACRAICSRSHPTSASRSRRSKQGRRSATRSRSQSSATCGRRSSGPATSIRFSPCGSRARSRTSGSRTAHSRRSGCSTSSRRWRSMRPPTFARSQRGLVETSTP